MADALESFRKNLPILESNDPRVTVGRCTYGSPRLLVWGQNERIHVGSFCSIADEVAIFGGGEHISSWVTTFPLRIGFGDPHGRKDGLPDTKGATRIGNDVWIGFRATILSGVVIGDGAIVGAGGVVTRDVSPYTIVAGNPARPIRKRFTDSQIEALLEIQWWNWPLPRIHDAVPLLCSEAIDHFINFANSMQGA